MSNAVTRFYFNLTTIQICWEFYQNCQWEPEVSGLVLCMHSTYPAINTNFKKDKFFSDMYSVLNILFTQSQMCL